MKLSSAKVDSAAIESLDGQWQTDLPELEDFAVLVRGLNNKQYRMKFEAMVRALPPSKRKNGAVDPFERDRITGLCILEHVLLDWKNLCDEDDRPIPYSKEIAKIYLTHPDYQKYYTGFFVAATRVGEAIEEDHAATSKNSAAPSGTA